MTKKFAFDPKPPTLLLAALLVVAVVVMLLLKLDIQYIAAMTTLLALVVAIPALIALTYRPNTDPRSLKDYVAEQIEKIEHYEQKYVPLRVDELLYSNFEGLDALRDRNASSLSQESLRKYPSIEKVMDAHPKFVLLGNPGAGKSTLLRHIELNLLHKFVDKGGLFPLSINLGVESNPTDPQTLLAGECKRDDLKAMLDDGSLFLLLDGLNEMPDDRVERSKKLREFLVDYGENRNGKWIIACREADYRDELAFDKSQLQKAKIAEIRVPPLEVAQVKQFLTTLVAKRQLSGTRANDFVEQVYGSQSMVERQVLAANPYALTMMLELFIDSQYTFPKTREQLYDTYIEKAYKDNRTGKHGKTRVFSEFKLLKTALQQLAYIMFVQGSGATVDRIWAARQIAPSSKKMFLWLGITEFYDDEIKRKIDLLSWKLKWKTTLRKRFLAWLHLQSFLLRYRLLGQIIEFILTREGLPLLTEAENLYLLSRTNQATQIYFFHQTIYEHLALPLIDFRAGNIDQWENLVRRLEELGAAARPALPKLSDAFISIRADLPMTHDLLYARLIAAQVEIIRGIMRIGSNKERELGKYLIVFILSEVVIQGISQLEIAFALAYAHILTQVLLPGHTTRTIDRALSSALKLAHTLNLNLEVDFDLDFAFDFASDRALNDDINVERDYELVSEINRKFLTKIAPYLDMDVNWIMDYSQEAQQQIHSKLRTLIIELSQMNSMT